MRIQSTAATHQSSQATPEPFTTDLSRMGLHLSADGSTITLSPQVLPHLFGRPARCDFTLTMATTALLRLRHLLTPGDDCLHLPVSGHLVTEDGAIQPTTRLIATATTAPRVRLEVTTWTTSPDGNQAWLDTLVLDDLTAPRHRPLPRRRRPVDRRHHPAPQSRPLRRRRTLRRRGPSPASHHHRHRRNRRPGGGTRRITTRSLTTREPTPQRSALANRRLSGYR